MISFVPSIPNEAKHEIRLAESTNTALQRAILGANKNLDIDNVEGVNKV